jgi:hypothetical protein
MKGEGTSSSHYQITWQIPKHPLPSGNIKSNTVFTQTTALISTQKAAKNTNN